MYTTVNIYQICVQVQLSARASLGNYTDTSVLYGIIKIVIRKPKSYYPGNTRKRLATREVSYTMDVKRNKMDTSSKKFHVVYGSRDERMLAWRENRKIYDVWRRTSDAHKFIEWKRKKQHDLCFICIKPLAIAIHVDHIFPLYLGGTNFKGNLCITHPKCNMDKGAQVYYSYKQACRRRHQFKTMLKAKRALAILQANPNTKLSKKQFKAIKLHQKFTPHR